MNLVLANITISELAKGVYLDWARTCLSDCSLSEVLYWNSWFGAPGKLWSISLLCLDLIIFSTSCPSGPLGLAHQDFSIGIRVPGYLIFNLKPAKAMIVWSSDVDGKRVWWPRLLLGHVLHAHQWTPRDGEEGCQPAARAVLGRAPRFFPPDLGIGIVTAPELVKVTLWAVIKWTLLIVKGKLE